MADNKELGPTAAEVNEQTVVEDRDFSLPNSRMYKQHKLGPFTTPWYASPRTQLGMVAFVCFLCPGMFNALSGLGGGGNADVHTADKMVSQHHLSMYPKSQRLEEKKKQ
jgi:hypothetical protein